MGNKDIMPLEIASRDHDIGLLEQNSSPGGAGSMYRAGTARANRPAAFLARYRQVAAAVLSGVVIMGGCLYYYNARKTAYAVEYEGRFLGYVQNSTDAADALATAGNVVRSYDSDIVIDREVKTEKVLLNSGKLVNIGTIEQAIEKDLLAEYTAFAISINGEETVVVKTEDDASKVLEGVRDYYISKESSDTARVMDVTFKDDIQVVRKIASSAKTMDLMAAVKKLIDGRGTTEKYAIKRGETLWEIARDRDMKLSQLIALNPKVKADTLHAGQSIYLSANEPYFNVETTLESISEESIPFSTQYVNSASLYRGQTRLVKKGEYGIKRIVCAVTKLNGIVTSSTILSAEVIKDPAVQVLARGTKLLSGGSGTGKFLWPISGVLTSKFGSRGGGFHKGLDIGAPQGTYIHAADSGVVIYAEYSRSYGQLVKIDHGNGFVTYYAHCSSMCVKVGDVVTRGQHIANVGHTGNATGNHVHFEIRLNDVPQNPLKYLN